MENVSRLFHLLQTGWVVWPTLDENFGNRYVEKISFAILSAVVYVIKHFW